MRNETEKSSKDRLILHPSIDYEHAMSLENMYHCYMINQGKPFGQIDILKNINFHAQVVSAKTINIVKIRPSPKI